MIFNLNKIPDYYRSIDSLPIHNWFKINETNDLNWLIIDDKKRPKKLKDNWHNQLIMQWDLMFEEFINEFGVPDMMRKILMLKRDIQVLKLDMALTGDKSLQTFIDIKEFELKQLTEEKGERVSEVKAQVEKFMGFRLPEKEVTVKDYYGYLETIKKHIKQQKSAIADGRKN